eukprot:2971682-Rhodomonas_salina.1
MAAHLSRITRTKPLFPRGRLLHNHEATRVMRCWRACSRSGPRCTRQPGAENCTALDLLRRVQAMMQPVSDSIDESTLVIRMRVNVNQKAGTLDEVRARRKQLL